MTTWSPHFLGLTQTLLNISQEATDIYKRFLPENRDIFSIFHKLDPIDTTWYPLFDLRPVSNATCDSRKWSNVLRAHTRGVSKLIEVL